ncbi:MAG TPA: hypothetical protein VFT45_09005, partial [Longimicrobium sp.]|nr:hypothetical protein [Longimicrobium sp.]
CVESERDILLGLPKVPVGSIFHRLAVILSEAPLRSRRERTGVRRADRRIFMLAAVAIGHDTPACVESERDILLGLPQVPVDRSSIGSLSF